MGAKETGISQLSNSSTWKILEVERRPWTTFSVEIKTNLHLWMLHVVCKYIHISGSAIDSKNNQHLCPGGDWNLKPRNWTLKYITR